MATNKLRGEHGSKKARQRAYARNSKQHEGPGGIEIIRLWINGMIALGLEESADIADVPCEVDGPAADHRREILRRIWTDPPADLVQYEA